MFIPSSSHSSSHLYGLSIAATVRPRTPPAAHFAAAAAAGPSPSGREGPSATAPAAWRSLGPRAGWLLEYPLVNIQKAIENGHL